MPPLPAPVAIATAEDVSQLRLLAIFHYVVAGMTALFALFPVIHLVFGIAMVTGAMAQQDPEARFAGWFFIAFASVFILCGLALATAIAVAGRNLQRRRHYTFCMVVAGLACMIMPFGTVLGVFTLVALLRPGVKSLFENTPGP